ncbi:MAG: dethiobiotin synthase [Chitinophagales bacterium]|nr:dethiobiotin synthase [Chitinophagales bacterium]
MNSKQKRIFIAGIDTNVGKTVASAIICTALKADYWKPVQTGSIEGTDSDFIRYVCGGDVVVHASSYCYREPVSPHYAASLENDYIHIEKINIPETDNVLIIEGAGGLMVPLNEEFLLIDLIKRWNIPVLLVSKNYLGSINHTLLSCSALKATGLETLGILFNGVETPSSESIIEKYSQLPVLGRINQTENITKEFIYAEAERLKHFLGQLL